MMEVNQDDTLTLDVDGKGRILIPVDKRDEHGIEKKGKVEIAILGVPSDKP